MPENKYTIHDGDKQSAALKSALQSRLTESSGVKKRLVVLQEIAVKIDQARTREEILDVIRLESRWLFKYHVCFLGVVNPARTHYVINTLSPVADSTELNFAHFALDEGMPGWVIKHHVSILEDISSGPAFSPAIEGKLKDLGIESMLIVPMRTGEDIMGALAFGSVKTGLYTDEDAALALHLAMYLAVALKNVTASENARKRITQIDLINQVSRQMTSMLHLDELVHVAASAIQKTFNYFDVTVFLISEERTHLILEAHSGNFVDFLPHGYRQAIGEGIVGHVASRGEKHMCNDITKEERYIAYAYHNTRSELAIPIRVENEVVGVLNVEDTRLHAFDETDAIVLETLCDQLGSAIKNAKLYDEIRKANMKLTEVDKMKSEFLGIVSHDFRSPLSSIMLAGRALLKNEGVQELKRVKEYLHLIVNQASRLNQLAEDTLSLTKLESGQLNYLFKIVNLERLIQDAVTLVRFSSRHQFEYTLDPNVTFIKGDQPKLRQVLQNLVSNAVKYSPHGGLVRIHVEDYTPEQILVGVSDEGIGIPANQMEKLFGKFSRVEGGESREIKGAGLGLWICREIVQAHGGKIWIESVMDKGTTFKFTLNKAQKSSDDK